MKLFSSLFQEIGPETFRTKSGPRGRLIPWSQPAEGPPHLGYTTTQGEAVQAGFMLNHSKAGGHPLLPP